MLRLFGALTLLIGMYYVFFAPDGGSFNPP
jgi:hypothetical protein